MLSRMTPATASAPYFSALLRIRPISIFSPVGLSCSRLSRLYRNQVSRASCKTGQSANGGGAGGADPAPVLSSPVLSSPLLSFKAFPLRSSGFSVLVTAFPLPETSIKTSLLRVASVTSSRFDVSNRKYSRMIGMLSRLLPTMWRNRRCIPADVSTWDLSNTPLSKKERLSNPCTTSAMSWGLHSPATPDESDMRRQSSSSHSL